MIKMNRVEKLRSHPYTQINFDTDLLTDKTYNGKTISETVGANVSFGDLLYLDLVDQKWKVAKADSLTTMLCEGMAMQDKTIDDECIILTSGYVRNDAWSWTADNSKKELYVSSVTAGSLSETAVSSSGHISQIAATIKASNKIHFLPNLVYAVHA